MDVLYEVTVTVAHDVRDEFKEYMSKRHIADVLRTGYFSGAVFAEAGDSCFRTSYRAKSEKALEAYLAGPAKDLREDFIDHFPQAELSRRTWTIITEPVSEHFVDAVRTN